ncbi:MAG: hypothetical protein GY853_14110 [PVC group bacterium]|nr:hypothetical protein [PVC group bacterium]
MSKKKAKEEIKSLVKDWGDIRGKEIKKWLKDELELLFGWGESGDYYDWDNDGDSKIKRIMFNIFDEKLEKALKKAVEKHINGEEFVDKIIERINRKQLGRKRWE